MWLYKLRPRSAFCFGQSGCVTETAEDIFHSDSLFGALASGLRMWRGESALMELLSQFQAGPPFCVTSLYPYAGSVLFFPRPRLPLSREGEREDKPDTWPERIRLVSQNIMDALLRHEPLDEQMTTENLRQDGEVWLSHAEASELPSNASDTLLWSRHAVSKATVDRSVPVSYAYHMARVDFRPGCGLYFLVQVDDASSRALVENALDYLSEAGLGAKGTTGYGRFSVESVSEFAPFWPSEGHSFITLSLYHPTEDELEAGVLNGDAAYEIVTRHSWTTSLTRGGQRSRAVSFVAEGSVLNALGRAHYGELVDVTPGYDLHRHPVYRYGYAFPGRIATGSSANEQ